jgi:hypothetical protein
MVQWNKQGMDSEFERHWNLGWNAFFKELHASLELYALLETPWTWQPPHQPELVDLEYSTEFGDLRILFRHMASD